MARKDALLGELTLARGETLRIGPQDVSTELQPVEDPELGDYGTFIHAIYFHITTREDIIRDIEEGTVDCPCLWAEVSEVLNGSARLFVAYDIGAGVTISQIPIRSTLVEPRFESRGPVLVGCSGMVSKRIYIILFRLVHIMFPSMESWKLHLMHSDEVTFDRDTAMSLSKIFVDVSPGDGSLIFSQFLSQKEMSLTCVKPNFLLSCLEANDVGDSNKIVQSKSTSECLRTVRHVQDVFARVKGVGQLSTPLPSPRTQHFFQSPAKKPIIGDSCMDIKTAVSLIELGTASDFRDGSLYLQSICKASSVADAAVRKGFFRAIVSASTSLLSSPIMGTVEQLSILTLTTSQILDHCSHGLKASKILVAEIIESLRRPIANYILSLQFITAMIHRPDVKDSAIELHMYNALSAMYINRLPLLEPLADALTASINTNCETHGATEDDDERIDMEQPSSLSSLKGSKAQVPMLGLDCLPTDEGHLSLSPSNSGLTRATRRNRASDVHSDIDSGLSVDEKHLSATHEMDQLAQALGESLVAQDLPCLIGLRRRMGSLSGAMSHHPPIRDDRSLLHVGSTSDLKAHKVFPNDSDDEEGSDISTSGVARDSEWHQSTSRNELESFSSKDETFLENMEVSIDICPYLVNAMLATHSPFPGCYQWDPDPSSLITADILSFPAHIFEGNAYISSCLKLLARISSTKEKPGHIFLVGIGNKLKSLVSSRSFGTEMGSSLAAYYLSITYEYVSLCSDAQMSSVFSMTALCPILQIISALQSEGPISEWSGINLILLNISVKILDRAISICDANEVGQDYIRRVFGEVDNRALSLLKDISRQTLLAVADYPNGPAEIGDIERNVLYLFSSLINLVNGVKGMENAQSGSSLAQQDDVVCKMYNSHDSEVLTRCYCLQQFSFLITPGSSLIRYTLEGEILNQEMEYLRGKSGSCMLSSRYIRLRNGVFSLLQGLFSAFQNLYVTDKEMMDYYVRLHFIRLLKLYHNPNKDHQAIYLCRQHLSMLCTLAQAARKSQTSHASKRFQHLSVVGFFVKEMSLEYEALESDVGHSQVNVDDNFNSSRVIEDRTSIKSSRSIQSSNDGSMFEELDETFKTGESKRESVVPPLSLNFSSDKLKSSHRNVEYSPGPNTSKSDKMILAGNDYGFTNEIDLGERVLERQGTSAAISLDTPLLRSGGNLFSPKESTLTKDLPSGFTFTGDLDEDVDRLEALGLEDTSDSESMLSSSSEDDSAQSTRSGNDETLVPSLLQKKQSIPRLTISSSMRSSLHKRNQSAELIKESEAADPGRSFLGNIEKQALGNGKMQAVRFMIDGNDSVSNSTRRDVLAQPNLLESERSSRLLYQDEELHILAIKLIFLLILDDDGQLNPSYCDTLPWEKKMQNIPFILQQHLNAEPTIGLLHRIASDLYDNVGKSAVIFLRVLSSEFFRSSWYLSRTRISGAVGAYATVHRCSLPWWAHNQGIVLKVIDAPKFNHDRCSQVEFYSEVYIHQKLSKHPRVCQMLDFGFDTQADALVLVLEEYKCSLKQWRLAQDTPYRKTAIFWAIFREIVTACIEILDAGVVHFDLKCDNILLNPLPGVSDEAFWKGAKSGSKIMSLLKKSGNNPHLSFKVVLGDFGESLLFPGGRQAAESGSTMMARGTDAFKSPEMLMIGGALQVSQVGYDRRRHHGAGAASDVWSLGCLLFELFTGQMLFSDNDWLQLAARVTTPGSQLITNEKQELIAGIPGVEDMLNFMLVRDPLMRPTLADVLHRLDSMSLDSSQGSPSELSPRSSRSSPGTGREKQNITYSEKSGNLPDLMTPARITCMYHLSDNLSVCPLSEYNKLSRASHSAKRKQVIILSSKLIFTEALCHKDMITSYSKSAVLESEDLETCMWRAQTFNDLPCVYTCPNMSDIQSKTLSSWIKLILEMTDGITDAGVSDILIISDNMDQLAAFTALAIMTKQTGSMYSTMVHGAHCGLDRHLRTIMLDILCEL